MENSRLGNGKVSFLGSRFQEGKEMYFLFHEFMNVVFLVDYSVKLL